MEIQFLAGRSGSGKTTAILEEIKEQLRLDPLGPPIIFLVPDQMTFLMEYELAKTSEAGGMIRAKVFSFTRLAWSILQQTGGANRQFVTSTGIQMLLRKVIEEQKDKFKVFKKASDKPGFVEQIEKTMAEFKRYCMLPEDIEKISVESMHTEYTEERRAAEKLHDLHVLYQQMEEHLQDEYVHSEDYLTLLAQQIPSAEEIKGAHIYIDGFYQFTPQQLLVIEQLLLHAAKITAAFTVDRSYHDRQPNELDLFRMTGKTYFQLYQLAKECGADISETIFERNHRHLYTPDLAYLEHQYEQRPVQPYQENTPHLTVSKSANKRAEIEGVARDILDLVREKGLRLRDISIVARHVDDYKDTLKEVFRDYDIPFFIDGNELMQYHPLIELIRSSLDVIKGNWRYEAVFRCVKTEFLFPLEITKNKAREQADQLENYCIAYGVKGERWTNGSRFHYRRFQSLDEDFRQTDQEIEMEQMLNDVKEWIAPPLYQLQKRLKNAQKVRDMVEAVYVFLEEIQVPDKLEKARLEAEEAGRLAEAMQHGQVWDAVIQLMDEFVDMLGDEELSFPLFQQMIDTGLASLKFALIPPSLDQVFIGSMDLSRMYQVKCTFIIGVNDGVIPARPSDESVLSEDDREWLKRAGAELAETGKERLLDEQFLIYQALSSPSHHLYLSYAASDAEGRSLLPSTLIKYCQELMPNHQQALYVLDPEQLEDNEQLKFVANEHVSLSYTVSQLQQWLNQYPISGVWWSVYNYLMTSPNRDVSKNIMSSLFFTNRAKPLKPNVTKELYGDHIQGSVSRMEKFNACAFSHFASHGLKLKDRQFYKLEAPDIGQLFHSALKHISDTLVEQKKDWKNLTKEDCVTYSRHAIEQLAPRLQKEILLSSNRHAYIKEKLQKILIRVSSILSEHAKVSGFSPVGLELGFGGQGPLPPFTFQLKNGCTMELVGRIDRVDKAEGSKGLLLRIVDYKSSEKGLDLAEVYYGLALQMLTYLDLTITYSKEWLGVEATPAGILYFHIHDPLIQAPIPLAEDEIEQEIYKKFKMKGLLLEDVEAVKLMDQTLDSGRSQVIQAGLKKDGSFRSDSAVLSEDHFHILTQHVRRTFEEAGERITNGEVTINPYKLKDQTPCRFCSFKSICQFDESIEDNDFRVLTSEKDDVVIDRIKKEGDQYANTKTE
ncbi:helicase-exonuclease AddAB subunit AddB [Bacillus pumilus]|uniref:helicase-exonuclease AddAB subunit AddB n=1 Tax=Bacillus pumilus TaxID=1408 RepID=UPI00119E3A05|nr:helicase-exonuclease AddAB subunit AddB [Bacillus pumilus]